MRFRSIVVAVATLAFAFVSAGASAEWPDKPIKFVVPFAPGGANDLMGRAAADAVSKRLKQTVIVENRPGAGAIVGAQYVANAQPDGYTFLVGAAGVVTNSFLVKNMPYQDSQLTPVGMIAVAPSVIVVNPSVAGEQPQGVHRVGEGAGRERRELVDCGHRQHAAFRRGDAQGSRRHQHGRRALQER